MSDNRDFIYTIPQTVLLDLTLHLVDLRVYALVRSFMDTTGDAYPSNGWLAKKLDVDPTTISRSISKLQKKGYLTRVEIAGRRHLMIGKPIPEKLVIHRLDLQIKGGRSTDQGGVDLQINQLDQRSITSNVINDHVKNDKKRTAKQIRDKFTNDEKCMYEKLLNWNVKPSLALKIVDKHTIATINNIIETGLKNNKKNMGAYINVSIKNLAAK